MILFPFTNKDCPLARAQSLENDQAQLSIWSGGRACSKGQSRMFPYVFRRDDSIRATAPPSPLAAIRTILSQFIRLYQSKFNQATTSAAIKDFAGIMVQIKGLFLQKFEQQLSQVTDKDETHLLSFWTGEGFV